MKLLVTLMVSLVATGALASAVTASCRFKVEIRELNGKWREMPVEPFMTGLATGYGSIPPNELKEFDGIREGVKMVPASLCEFLWERPVEVRVFTPECNEKVEVSSLGALGDIRKNAGEIVFRLDGPEMALVRSGEDYLQGLSIYARPKPIAPDVAKFQNVIRFESGLHTAENCNLIRRDSFGAPVLDITENNTLVIIEPGAKVEAAFDVKGAKHVEICGGGRIDLSARLPYAGSQVSYEPRWAPFRRGVIPAVYMHLGAEDLVVRDIVIVSDFRGINSRNARGLVVKNVGVFTSVTNGDGLNFISTENIRCDGLYIRSQDDCFCAYNNCDSISWLWDYGCVPRKMCDVKLSNSLLASNARAIVLGGHGLSERNGANILEDFEVSGCRILGNMLPSTGETLPESHRRYWSGIFRILSQSDELVRNIRFHDIDVEWVPGYLGSAFHLAVRTKDQVSYSEKSGGWRIEDVSFRNIRFWNVPSGHTPSILSSPANATNDCEICRLSFDGVTFDGKLIGEGEFETQHCKMQIGR